MKDEGNIPGGVNDEEEEPGEDYWGIEEEDDEELFPEIKFLVCLFDDARLNEDKDEDDCLE